MVREVANAVQFPVADYGVAEAEDGGTGGSGKEAGVGVLHCKNEDAFGGEVELCQRFVGQAGAMLCAEVYLCHSVSLGEMKHLLAGKVAGGGGALQAALYDLGNPLVEAALHCQEVNEAAESNEQGYPPGQFEGILRNQGLDEDRHHCRESGLAEDDEERDDLSPLVVGDDQFGLAGREAGLRQGGKSLETGLAGIQAGELKHDGANSPDGEIDEHNHQNQRYTQWAHHLKGFPLLFRRCGCGWHLEPE